MSTEKALKELTQKISALEVKCLDKSLPLRSTFKKLECKHGSI